MQSIMENVKNCWAKLLQVEAQKKIKKEAKSGVANWTAKKQSGKNF